MRKEEIWAKAPSLVSESSVQKERCQEPLVSDGYKKFISFPGSSTHLDVTAWFEYPELALAFVDATRFIASKMTPGSRIRFEGELRRGFFAFLQYTSVEETIKIENLSRDLLEKFVAWVVDSEGNRKIAVDQKRTYLSALRRIIKSLKEMERWSKRLQPKLDVPRKFWPKSPPSGGRVPLDHQSLVSFLKASDEEMKSTMARLEKVWIEVELRAKEFIEKKISPDFELLPDFLIELQKEFGDGPVSSKEIYEKRPDLGELIRLHGGFDSISECRYPSDRKLIPFVLVLAFYTAFNPETTRGFLQKHVKYSEILGAKRVVLKGEKPRANGSQMRSFPLDQPGGPAEIIDFLNRWTSKIRPLAPADLQGRLFLFVLSRGRCSGQICNWDNNSGRRAPKHGWYPQLIAFQKKHGLKKFSLAHIRNTSLDQVRDLFLGDIKAVQAAGGQHGRQVVQDHYNSAAARARNDEQLANVMAVRERWASTRGRAADARGEAHSSDLGSVTPGFRCFDPFDSPVPGEVRGRLCRAYGWCPACALAHVNRNDAHSLARLLQLKNAFHDAQSRVSPQRWLEVWAPKSDRLQNYWLHVFNSDVWKRAESLSLSPIPEIE